MNTLELIIIISISFLVLFQLIRNYKRGISLAVFLLIMMPGELFAELGRGLPTLTIYRAIMIILVFHWIFLKNFNSNEQKTPILKILLIVLITKLFSLIVAFNFVKALDGIVVFVIEIILFYVLLFKAVDDKEVRGAVLNAVGLAVYVIAVLGFIEKYTQFNPVDYISPSDHIRFSRNANIIYSTLSHPIHLGMTLSMGWPVCLYLMNRENNKIRKMLLWIGNLFIYASLFFCGSRGPWLAFVLAAIVLILLKFPRIKWRILTISVMTCMVLILLPGVYYSIYGLSATTFRGTTVEGGSFLYRFELYKKAYNEVNKSTGSLYFGYGDGAAHSMDLWGEVSYSENKQRFWSWDSEFAVLLLHGGFVGLIANLLLYFSFISYLIKGLKLVADENRDIMAALIASTSVFIFMMTNVAIYSPQLHFMLWTNVAIGLTLCGEEHRNKKRLMKIHG